MIYHNGVVTIMLLFLFVRVSHSVLGSGELRCKAKEREALLTFKEGLIDEYGFLSSWGSEEDKNECCEWKGIKCSNKTGHVIRLQIDGSFRGGYYYNNRLRGKISSALLELSYLNNLDLTSIDFGHVEIPKFFGSLKRLRHLTLGGCWFSGVVPHQLGNLINLRTLDLAGNYLSVIPDALVNLTNLRTLDLSGNLLNVIPDALGNLTNLRTLHLSGNLLNVIPDALGNLTNLRTLDLSGNHLNVIPDALGNLTNLRTLDLSSNHLSVIPDALGNLTNLRTLDLGYNELVLKSLNWLSHLSLLSVLDLSYSSLRDTNSIQNIFTLPSLIELYLSECKNFANFFIYGPFTSSVNISLSLRRIDLSDNNLSVIPDAFGRFTLLEYIDLSYNNLQGGIPKVLWDLSHLQTLILSGNNLSEPLSEIFYKLSMGASESIKILKLDENQFNGSFPDNFGHFSRLERLDLSYNQIRGPIPDLSALVSLRELHINHNKLETPFTSLWQLSKLEILDASFNSFEGTIFDADLSKLQNLKALDLSYNSLVLNFTVDWIPPFQLSGIGLACCKMGPRFPAWLQTQSNFSWLDLSLAGISDEVPKWLWDLSPRMSALNLSHNQISGTVPKLPPIADISYNNFSGHLRSLHRGSFYLKLNNNFFFGSISSICTTTYSWLPMLDFSNNLLSGELPSCWDNITGLEVLNLNNNKLSGQIPQNLGSLTSLRTLQLHGNNFSLGLPSSLKNCKYLSMIDVGGNKLTGNVPPWIGTHLKALKFLILGHNNFYGAIPFEICYLDTIQVLDLSRNSLSGTIPQCFDNFTSLVQKNKSTDVYSSKYSFSSEFLGREFEFIDDAWVQWKGQEEQYRRALGLLKLIDLSSNSLAGNIPHEFSHMRALISLNLSRNYLSGNIISNIGEMEMLECLDLSGNQLSGEIPTGLAELHFLAVLDLSNNSLSGKIPSGTQLQGFNASAYAENSGLCGPPLPVCPEDGPKPPTAGHAKQDETDDGIVDHEFIISMVFGFIVGFWGVVGTLVVRNSWRNAYFNFFNAVKDWTYVTTTVYVGRLHHKLMAIAHIQE